MVGFLSAANTMKLVKKAVPALGIIFLLSGCNGTSGTTDNDIGRASEPAAPLQKVSRYVGTPSHEIPFVYTAKKQFALTFNGMADRETMTKLLDELDRYQIKATFFLPGMRVAEEPDIAKDILKRGHEIENNTLSQPDLNKLDYQGVYKEIKLTNDVIKRETGVQPKYIRTRSGSYPADLPLIAAQLGMKGVVSYNINPKDRDMQSAEELGHYIGRYISRGGIISLNTDINPEVIKTIPYISRYAKDIGYQPVTLDQMVSDGGFRKPVEEIPGYQPVHATSDYQNASYKLIEKVDTDRKEIALTFDDFGSDKTITQILDILEAHNVKATFFLRAKGVESNPNLARAMVEGGHDVANHTYEHTVLTKMTPAAIQEDIVKAHEVIANAIQEQPVMLFRPPTGAIDDERAKAIAAVGYPNIAMYDVTTLDWDASNSADDIVNGVMTQTQKGSIILLHMLDDIHTIEALPRVLENLEAKGYTFVKMQELIDQNP
ncbi:polysaccharide deacetylase family protein [Saccharibacillus kuerlensis]|uniref:NodB homology domain-containing protein n=1 Tax=Saccharibacillus kuerlensis TaxID=459527 RepID=A0ABQ2L662_9BACL|nr:polysaccharide deacetylase family protein [Saccharibacillus kuerlensis]GGO04892.1 hypothetical protein GCM10010969_30630 [Saccharibacillus kuerlensis]